MKNNLKFTALIALMTILTSSAVLGQGRRSQNRMLYQGQCQEIPELSADQKSEIAAINESHKTKIDNMRDSFWAEEDITKANEIKAAMILEQNNHLKEIGKVLDKEQLAYFNENVINSNSGRGRAIARSGRGGSQFGQGNRPGRGRTNARAHRQGRHANNRW